MLPLLTYTNNLVNQKVDTFIDSMIEDIQDIIKVEVDDVSFTEGVLPPRYKELKEEMKTIIANYILENMRLDFMEHIQHTE